MTEPLPKWLSVQHHTYFNKHSRFQSGRQHLFSKFQLFYLSFKRMTDFFLRCQDTISVPKFRYAVSYIACFASLQDLHYRNLHFRPACICDAKHFITYAIVIGKWGRMFLSLCHTPPSFSPIRNHICTLIKTVLRFQ